MNLDFEQAAEEFLRQMTQELYLNGAGLKDSLDIVPIFDEYRWLFERGTVDKAFKRRDVEGRYIAAFVADGHLDAEVKDLSEEITNAMTQATVEWDGEQVPCRRASILIANEPDPARRRDLEARVHARTEEQNPNRLERTEKLHARAKDLGFPTYLAMYDENKRLRIEWLLGQMRELLERTEEIYASELEHYLKELGVPPRQATPADLAYLFRAPQFDRLFPQDKLVPSLKATLAGMGIDLDSQENVRLDTDSRPLKSPRAFCAPVCVPDEVHLVIAPRGGQDDYKAIMHEAGHAEHFAHTSPSLPFAFKRLGDLALSESYAFLMDNLLKNGRWFAEILAEHHIDDYLRLSRFHKLWILRRYAAKLAYEKLLHTSSDVPRARTRYVKMLGQALRLKISPANYLADVDDGLYVAAYIRAWMFEVVLRRHLEDSYGKLWFRTPQAGEFLIGLWRHGQRFGVDELAHQLRYERLDAESLIQELAR